MDFKRALVSPQKGTFCKSIRRLLEAKRACLGFELSETYLQVSAVWKDAVCRRRIDIVSICVLSLIEPQQHYQSLAPETAVCHFSEPLILICIVLVRQWEKPMSGQTLEHMVEMCFVMCQPYDVVYVVHCQLGDAPFHSNTLFDREVVYSFFQTIDNLFGIRQTTKVPSFVALVHC